MSRRLRCKILQLLSFIPDVPMVRLQYKMKTGVSLNLKNPRRFTEKVQYYKLFYRDPVMKQCVDKADVRDYISDQGYRRILVGCLGIYNRPSEIDFSKLPQKFVVKDTLGGGGNSVVLVKNKSELDKPKLMAQLRDEDELVISDDGSTDETMQIINSFNDKRIVILPHEKKPIKFAFDYTTHNFENAIVHSRGDVIFLADQDDVWLPNKYKVMTEALENCDIVISDCKIVDSNLSVIEESKFENIHHLVVSCQVLRVI